MIIIRTRQPNPELENKILTILRQEHIEAEQFSIRSPGQLVFPGLMVNETTREVLCEDRAVSLTRLEFDLLLPGHYYFYGGAEAGRLIARAYEKARALKGDL